MLAFVFAGSAIADADEKKKKKIRNSLDIGSEKEKKKENSSELDNSLDIGSEKEKKKENGSELDIETRPLSNLVFILPIEDIENLTIEENVSSLNIGEAPANPAALSRVQVSQLRPSRSSVGTVVFTWITKTETENAGFNILRSETRNGPFKPINSALIQGAGTTKKKQTYQWTDVSAKPNVVYYYQLEMISFAGTSQRLSTVRLQGHVSASGKVATKWAMLKARR